MLSSKLELDRISFGLIPSQLFTKEFPQKSLKDLGDKVCRYCHTGLEDINLKNWFISSYKED